MKSLFIALAAVFLAWKSCESTAATTDLHALHVISNREAGSWPPVTFEATVTYYRDYDSDLFVQDAGSAIYVFFRPAAHLLPGDRVQIRGHMQASFRPIVVAENVALLHHGHLPEPITVTAADLFSARRDCLLASVRGTVRSAQMVWSAGQRNIYLQILIDGGYIDAAVNSGDDKILSSLLDSDVEITGVVTSEFDDKMQLSGARLDVQSLSDVRILKPASAGLQDLPVVPIEEVLSGYHVRDLSTRTQIKGTITYYEPRRAVVLQSGAQSLWVATQTDIPLKIGDVAYASGFPAVQNGYLMLDHGEIRDTGVQNLILPQSLTWNLLGAGQYAFSLVAADGELVMQAREAAQDEYVLTSHGHLFSAIYRHPRGMSDAELPPMKKVPVGSVVRVTGINMFYRSDPFDGPVESNILLRDPQDVSVIAPPPWLNKRNLEIIATALLLVVLAFAAQGWRLERRIREQTAAVAGRTRVEAEIERRRSRILEMISRSGSLDEILEMVAELASFQLGGVPCWCEINNGQRFGTYPADGNRFNLVREVLRTASGDRLGSINVRLEIANDSNPPEALSKAARLASLALETRRLYAELVHRSEFDLLTKVHSRLFFERELELMIALAEAGAAHFGLIYFDLDGFKKINDSFGHGLGDEYLQQVANRIKSQLRPQDILARLGGDEFAVLVPSVGRRSDIEEIIARLESSFLAPILLDGHRLPVSASFGLAYYPDDGATQKELLDIADVAMYAAKAGKRTLSREPQDITRNP